MVSYLTNSTGRCRETDFENTFISKMFIYLNERFIYKLIIKINKSGVGRTDADR